MPLLRRGSQGPARFHFTILSIFGQHAGQEIRALLGFLGLSGRTALGRGLLERAANHPVHEVVHLSGLQHAALIEKDLL